MLRDAVKKDAYGFEDIDDFWSKADQVLVPSTKSTLVRDYIPEDDSYSISEDDEDDEEDFDDDDDEELPLEDSKQSISFVKASTPASSRKTPLSSSVKQIIAKTPAAVSTKKATPVSAAPVYDDHQPMEDDYVPPAPSTVKPLDKSNRRVSFGADTRPVEDDDERAKKPKSNRGRKPKSMTPGSFSALMKTPKSDEFPRGRKLADDSFVASTDDDEDTDEEGESGGPDDSGFTDSSYLASVRKRKLVIEEEETDAGRRSKRATAGQRLAFWKNERPVYDGGVLIGVTVANPTPGRKISKQRPQARRQLQNHLSDDDDAPAIRSPAKKRLSKIKLPSDVLYIPKSKSEVLSVWDEATEGPKDVKVVCIYDTLLPLTALPVVTTARKPGKEHLVGYAAQSFNVSEADVPMSGWISGFLELPPGAIKDAEGVGECSQVFFVSTCQAGSLEFAMSDPVKEEWDDSIAQRVVLSEGDSFHVPPGNIYRLENHSTDQVCKLYWTIIKPYKGPLLK